MEEYVGPRWGAFRAFIMSAPADSDLLNAANWTSSTRVGLSPSWLDGKVGGILEGNAVVAPGGNVVNLLRVEQPNFDEVVALMQASGDGKTLSFDAARDFIDFPGGA